ncbi:unnamed protein product [Vitrella brassicaformis CCMP3155]|uniref:Uncharacterized protein n=2 Tax=Vitrella brassicaformis TaxID=1169539 RepID=A0A0G4FI92_VITBC|nr:unnamed protein product [Vitrella brassicaformis CCMP3155]|mmetsp:Transcript_24481/g.60482  ORF Transcript_24481/g.60482 Transcript_24481/m.60482 type:complete len:169 (+) Transcript_24481:93-599(+)|eukprot:CEM13145.1 unnamed protein product [Vitrella brassicaformis CCMP3155]
MQRATVLFAFVSVLVCGVTAEPLAVDPVQQFKDFLGGFENVKDFLGGLDVTKNMGQVKKFLEGLEENVSLGSIKNVREKATLALDNSFKTIKAIQTRRGPQDEPRKPRMTAASEEEDDPIIDFINDILQGVDDLLNDLDEQLTDDQRELLLQIRAFFVALLAVFSINI